MVLLVVLTSFVVCIVGFKVYLNKVKRRDEYNKREEEFALSYLGFLDEIARMADNGGDGSDEYHDSVFEKFSSMYETIKLKKFNDLNEKEIRFLELISKVKYESENDPDLIDGIVDIFK